MPLWRASVLIPFESGHLVFPYRDANLVGFYVLIPFESGHLVFLDTLQKLVPALSLNPF